MILFRTVKISDAESIHQLAMESGYGLTTLPKDIALLNKRIELSRRSFQKNMAHPEPAYYLFVLEDVSSKQVIGTSAIEAITGAETPFYSYKLSRYTQICSSLSIRSEHNILTLVNDNQHRSEVCTLYLQPDYRVNGYGLLLSRARFLFMAMQPQRFCTTTIAEMRGVSDEKGHSPFWNNVGRHFFHLSFVEADRLTMLTDKQFIADLMPRSPLYVELLSKKAQAVIGKPHTATLSAVNLLEREGFSQHGYVDIFDAGPTLECPTDKIYTVAQSSMYTINKIVDEISSARYIITNNLLDFRATLGHLMLNPEKGTCVICKTTANILEVNMGDSIRCIPLQTPSTSSSDKESS